MNFIFFACFSPSTCIKGAAPFPSEICPQKRWGPVLWVSFSAWTLLVGTQKGASEKASTCHSSLVALPRPPTSSSLCTTDRSFRYIPHLVSGINSLVLSTLFQPSISVLPVHAPTKSSHSVNSPLSPSITPSLFHSWLKTYVFHKSFPPLTLF